MDSRNQTDSILMTLLRSAMDNAQNKIRSITSPVECLIETSKFYELAIIQIDASLKLVKELEDQIPESIRKKMITDLIELEGLLHAHLNNTKCPIIKNNKASKKILRDQNVTIEQMQSDINMFKEKCERISEQIDQIDQDRHLDQQWRWLIEKETILIAMKGYIHDQSFEYSKKDVIIARLLEERKQLNLQTMAMEEHYMLLINECQKEFQVYDNDTKLDSMLQNIQDEFHVLLKPLLTNVQQNVNEKLHKNLSRLDGLKQQVDSIFRLAVSVRNEGLVYKKAFERRCENLLLAETEVDLLGDQVEALQDLLQNIYLVLEENSSVLSSNSQVMDMLKMIKKEFDGLIIRT